MELNNKKINIDVDTISVIYRQYKDYFLPLGVVLASFMILFFIVIPQTQQYLTNADALKAEQQKLDILKNNDNFLTNLDEGETDNQLKILSSTLPSDKDFAGVMNAISNNASKSNVSVGDFKFRVGDLSVSSNASVVNAPLDVNVSLTGDTQSIISFINQAYKASPLTEIKAVKLDGENTTIEMLFYYKPFSTQGLADDQPILSLSPAANSLITQISSWNNFTAQSQLPLIPNISPDGTTGNSSFSGTVNPEPF